MGAEIVWSAVGRQPALNAKRDQEVLQTLLNRIPRSLGGAEGSLQESPQERTVSASLQAAIEAFQNLNVSPQFRDGRVDPNGPTILKLNQLADSSLPVQIPWPPPQVAPAVVATADFEIRGVPLYGQKEMGFPAAAAENACWWAAIKMVRDTGGVLHDDPPSELKNSNKALDMIAIEAIYPRYQMYAAYPSPNPEKWTAAALLQALQEKGPMCACGRFAAGDRSTSEYDGHVQHAVVLYGVGNNGSAVVVNDPWQPMTRRILLDDFNSRLHVGRSRLIAATKHIKNWQTVPHPSNAQ